jgi:hypothetical protein
MNRGGWLAGGAPAADSSAPAGGIPMSSHRLLRVASFIPRWKRGR